MSSYIAGMKLTKDSAQKKLDLHTSDFEIIEYVPGGKPSSFLHKPTGAIVHYQYGSLVHKLKKNPDFIPRSKRLTKDKAQEKLALITDRYELVEFIPGKCSLSKFYDKSRDKIVEGNFNYVIQNLKRNPDYMVQMTDEERSSVYQNISDKVKETNLEKYGVPCVFQVPEVQEKVHTTRKARGLTKTIQGKTIRELSETSDFSVEGIRHRLKRGLSAKEATNSVDTSIESSIRSFLDSMGVEYIKDRKFGPYRPDFRIESHKLIIECDGLYWHSDKFKDKNYHLTKKKFFEDRGYDSLFFREDEITQKLPIVCSIIRNKLGAGER